MRTIVAVMLVAVFAVSASAGDAVVTSDTPHGKFELTVKSSPSTDRDGVFTFDAVLKNLTSGEIIAEPQVVFASTEGFKVSTKSEEGPVQGVVGCDRFEPGYSRCRVRDQR